MTAATEALAKSAADALQHCCKDIYGKEFDELVILDDAMGGTSVFADRKERTLWIAFMDNGTSSVIFDHGPHSESRGDFDADEIESYVLFLIGREVDPAIIAERIMQEASDVFEALADQ